MACNPSQILPCKSRVHMQGVACNPSHVMPCKSHLCMQGVACNPSHVMPCKSHLHMQSVACNPSHVMPCKSHLHMQGLSCNHCHVVVAVPSSGQSLLIGGLTAKGSIQQCSKPITSFRRYWSISSYSIFKGKSIKPNYTRNQTSVLEVSKN